LFKHLVEDVRDTDIPISKNSIENIKTNKGVNFGGYAVKSEVSLLNEYYIWKKVELNGVTYYIKGNIFFNNSFLSPEDLAELISPLLYKEDHDQEKNIKNFLKELNGEFAIVAETESKIFCAVDKIRSIPLFYTITEDTFIVSDSACYLKDKINHHLNEENAAEFMLVGYVTGSDTLFNGIKQIRNGEILSYQKETDSLKTSYYFRFLHGNYYELPEDKLFEMLDSVLVNVFSRLIESTIKQGKRLVVPLSGGLDSRIIVTMLKRLRVNDVICISYGREGNRQSMISKQVAKALGYEWFFVKYTTQKCHECCNSKEGNYFQEWAGNLSSLPHIHDFLALRELKNQRKIPDNSVLVPGHTGDVLSGSHIPKSYLDNSRRYDLETFLIDSLRMHYNLWKLPYNYELEPVFKEKLNNLVFGLEINDNETCANAIEFFDFNERQPKFIINSVRAYEFFGYEWRMPFWDTELINFYLKIPLKHRVNQDLYKKYARDRLFSGDFSILKKIDCTTDILNLKPLEKRSKYEKLQYYRTFIHSYYDEKIDNPIWGSYFENPFISRFLIKFSRYESRNIEKYPMLKTIIDYRNETKYPMSVNGMSTLSYLSGIKERT
jgi:asparagine synthase (glutamine-hydrolysing)